MKQSGAKHFAAAFGAIPLHVEGFPRKTQNLTEWFEYRFDGPFIKRTSPHDFYVTCEINIAVMVIGSKDAYRIDDLSGLAQGAFGYVIPVAKHGDVAVDSANDGSQLGCLTLDVGRDDEVVTSLFGKTSHDTEVFQASVEAHYRMFLDA
jgi:hypothetical protein